MLLAAMLAPGCVDLSRSRAPNRPVQPFEQAKDAAVPPTADAAVGVVDLGPSPPEAAAAPLTPDAGSDDRGPTDAPSPDGAASDLAAADALLLSGLALYLKFDELSGTEALDSSGHGVLGLYTGADGTPSPTGEVPATMFPNPLSRAFTLSNRHAIQASNITAVLKEAPALTVSLWYRATVLDISGSELVSVGDNLFLRLRSGGGAMDFVQWIRNSPGPAVTSTCRLYVVAALNGQWHHVAAVSTATSARVYFDGVERCSVAIAGTLVYERGPDLWVGRQGRGNLDYDFDGNIDELRLYTRALSPAEVTALAQGHE